MKKILQLILSILFFLTLSCNENNEKTHRNIPHPDSLGVGTIEYIQGEKEAENDIKNGNYKLFLGGTIPIDSLEFEEMKQYFKLKYNLTLEYPDFITNYQTGYNNEMIRALKARFDIDIKKELHKYYNK